MHNPTATPEKLKEINDALMGGYQAFRFLAETFGAMDMADAELTLSEDAVAGLARFCEDAAARLMDAYGPL